jgi:hypothetical protein
MPCWTTTTIGTDVSKFNQERLQAVLTEKGFNAKVVDGKLEILGDSIEDNARINNLILREYTARTINEGAKRFGWQVKSQSTTEKNLIQIQLRR